MSLTFQKKWRAIVVAVCGPPLLSNTISYLFIVVISDMVGDEKNCWLLAFCVKIHFIRVNNWFAFDVNTLYMAYYRTLLPQF